MEFESCGGIRAVPTSSFITYTAGRVALPLTEVGEMGVTRVGAVKTHCVCGTYWTWKWEFSKGSY